MSLENNTSINDALRRFDRLAGLEESRLEEMAQQVETLTVPKGTCVLELGSRDTRVLFLLQGRLELIAGDGASHVVRHTDAAALGPVSRLRPSRYRVKALSDVQCLMIEQQLLDAYAAGTADGSMVIEESYLVSEPNELINDSATHALMFDVFDDLNHGRVVVPSDPEVAVRVGRSLGPLGGDMATLASALSACPALTLKVVRAAMSGRGRGRPPRSCKEAIERLGREDTFGLAVNCVLRESLRTQSTLVQAQMRNWWERTMRVAAISSVLARTSERFDPDYAALIGLLHGIAEPVLLGYADRHPDLGDMTALDNVVHENRAELGRILLTMWGLPREVIDAAAMCNHWGYDHQREADYTDIVLVAQWHATIGSDNGRRRPRFEDIPAFARLGMQSASPESSVRIVEAARTAIDRIDALLVC